MPRPDIRRRSAGRLAHCRAEGAGSNDIRAEKLFVPEFRTLDWALLAAADNPGTRIHPDPIVHTPMATLLNLVAPSAALGAAEYAVELFRERILVRKVKNTLDNRQADSPSAQARYSQASGLVVTARLHWEEAIKIVSAANERQPSALTDEERARYRLSSHSAGRHLVKRYGSSWQDREAARTGFRILFSGSNATSTSCSTTQPWLWIRSLNRRAAACWV